MKPKGYKTVFTGDGLDELFGYPWQFHLTQEEFSRKQEEMWAEMGFSSIPMAESVGMTIKAPYLDPLFMEWAKKLPIKVKINITDGVKYSKWLLRKAYEDIIPRDVVWRPKAPLEQGTGTEILRTYFNDMIPDQEFEEKKKSLKPTTSKSKTKSNSSTTSTSAKSTANPKTSSPKPKAPSNAPTAKATSKPRFSSAKSAEPTPSNPSPFLSKPNPTLLFRSFSEKDLIRQMNQSKK